MAKTGSTQVLVKTKTSRPLCVGVSERKDFILDTFKSAPAAHDEGVIGSNNSDYINTLRFERIVVLKITRQVVGVAGGSERSGYGEQDDFLALPFVG